MPLHGTKLQLTVTRGNDFNHDDGCSGDEDDNDGNDDETENNVDDDDGDKGDELAKCEVD